MNRRYSMPFGAQICDDGPVRFRLWAPNAGCVQLSLEGRNTFLPLAKREGGWFELVTRDATAGTLYRFRIDQNVEVPDPASRFQPQDVHGPSEVVDPTDFDWQDSQWRGRPWEEAVIYELHVGAFTPEGTFKAVERRLDYLRELGITALELMPVADFSGARNWGYDGVLPYAPDSSYGRPEDLKHLVQSAHDKGLMIFLDVVYNHFGPDGNYLRLYSPQFFTDRHRTPWGDGINFDGADSRVVRDFFIHNALYWLEEYHFDGLRLDAVHAIADDSHPDIITQIAAEVRSNLGNHRLIHLMLENADNVARYLCRDQENHVELYDVQWNDDIHHALHVLLTGESDGYYHDYIQQPIRQLAKCLAEGFAFQGEYSEYHNAKRGEPSADLPPSAFLSFLQNHDQIGNRAFGERISQLADPNALRAAIEILLLAPQPPLLFMGEEFAAESPFLFFCDFTGELASAVTVGRRNEFARFAKFNYPEQRQRIPDPNAEQTYLRSKLDWENLRSADHAEWRQFYRKLLSIRQETLVPLLRGIRGGQGKIHHRRSKCLAIDWILARGIRLQLRANLANEWLKTVQNCAGIRFYCSDAETAEAVENNRLPPWSVVWSLSK